MPDIEHTDVRKALLAHGLEENIRNLNDIAPAVPHSLLLINYNSLMDDYHKGSLTGEVFTIRQTRLWESLFYYTGKLQHGDLKKLMRVLTGKEEQDTLAKQSILYIAASPKNIAALQVDHEFKRLKAILDGHQDHFELLLPLLSVTLEDFLQAKHRYKPAIIHFSGHGLEEGLLFATSQNVFQVIPTEILKDVFKGMEAYTKIVVLNACYASAQAKIISANGIYVIGMNAPITDEAALYLSENFYRFLTDGQSAEESFRNIKSLLRLNYPDEAKTLEMWKDGTLLAA
jgi:hypothetical protein